jgi:tRNA-dihydrouridine synthase A
MLVDQAVVRVAESRHLLEFEQLEHPIVAQLGGNDPSALARASAMWERSGFDEINLNVGCPAESAQRCTHGAGLLLTPELPQLVRAMQDSVGIPVSVKCRVGVNEVPSAVLS